MRFEFFQGQMERLRRVYSPASLNEERVQVIWDRFKSVDGYKFQEAINHLIGEFTTQALPSLSRFSEAVSAVRGMNGATSQMQEMLPAHFCEPCRDFGFLFEGDLLVNCECVNGRRLSPERLAHHQKNYERGKQFLKNRMAIFKPLPYDQNERIESVEWV
jgi:hypothetical protein